MLFAETPPELAKRLLVYNNISKMKGKYRFIENMVFIFMVL